MGKESEVGDLYAGVVKDAGTCEQQYDPGPEIAAIHRGRDDHRFRHEPAEKRKGRDRSRPDHAETGGPGHGLVKPAQLGPLDRADTKEHRPHRHEEQAFEQDVRERVRHRTVDGQFCSDTDAHHHEAELVVEAVGQHASQVVLDHGIEDRERRHRCSDRHEDLCAGKTARQCVDGDLGREPGKEHRPCSSRFRISVL